MNYRNSKNILLAIATAILCLMLPARSLAQDETALYQRVPSTGTSITRKIVLGGVLPIRKVYGELSESQRKRIRDYYNDMPEADEPPYPMYGLVSIYEPLAKLQSNFLGRGEVEMYVTVGPTGEPQSVAVYKTPDKEISEWIAGILMRTEFKPAVCGGRACAMEFPLLLDLTVSY